MDWRRPALAPALILASQSFAQACTCDFSVTVDWMKQQADVVFWARVESVDPPWPPTTSELLDFSYDGDGNPVWKSPPGGPVEPDPLRGRRVELKVLEVLKGRAAPRYSFRSGYSHYDAQVRVGQEYRLFLTADQANGTENFGIYWCCMRSENTRGHSNDPRRDFRDPPPIRWLRLE